jgi:3-oxoacyl-[acyl-carrier-protein] synthase II
MQAALHSANLQPNDIDYINAHATSTPLGDLIECKAISEVFQTNAQVGGRNSKPLFISSTKGALGHMLGAAGAIEALICALCVKHDVVPPTLNVTQIDPEIKVTA